MSYGNYFGEISLLYNGYRTATVTSENYGNLGVVTQEFFYNLCQAHPLVKTAYQERCKLYSDAVSIFLRSCLRSLPYLKNVSEDVINSLIYSMREQVLEPEYHLQVDTDLTECLVLIFEGVIEVYTMIDNQKVQMALLGRGSMVN